MEMDSEAEAATSSRVDEQQTGSFGREVLAGEELLEMAKVRLTSALELLSGGSVDCLLDASPAGASLLAHDAGEALQALFERRVSDA